MKKKVLAFLLAAAMLTAFCGCGAKVEAYNEPVSTVAPKTEAAAVSAQAEETAVAAEPLDFAGAYAAYEPDTVVFTVEGENVTWQEFFYEIAYNASVIAAQEGTAFTSWDDMCPLYVDGEGNMVFTYSDVVLQTAINYLIQYHIMDKHMTELGIELDEESLAMLEEYRQQTIDVSFAGDEAAFLAYLESIFCTEELWNWINETDAKYAQAFDDLYGEMGSGYADEDVLDYAAGDPNGAWTEYVQLRMICLYDEEEAAETENAASDEPASGEASEEPEEPDNGEVATQIMSKLIAAEDKESVYKELYAQYNEETGLDYFPDGWCVYQGDTADEIYITALSMDVDEVRVVSIDGAEAIVWKVPVEPDAGVTYDATTGTMYTLRYYAAWQEYAEMINDWITTGTAAAQWAEGFENFSLNSVFGR